MQKRRNPKTAAGRSKAAGIQPQPIHANELAVDDAVTARPATPPGFVFSKSLQQLAAVQSGEKTGPQLRAKSRRDETWAESLAREVAEKLLENSGLSPESLRTLTAPEKLGILSLFLKILTPNEIQGELERITDAYNAANYMTRMGSGRIVLFEDLKRDDIEGYVHISDVRAAFIREVRQLFSNQFEINPELLPPVLALLESLAEEKTSSTIRPPEAETHGPTMVEQDDKVLVQNGVRYRPLPLAAQLAQAPRQTLLNWIKNKTEFSGRPLQSYYLAPVDRYFVSEESIQRIADRFVKWPSQEKAGRVTLGETKDKSGFLTMSEGARIIGVSARTMWLWASQDKAPTDKPLDIIKCTTSDHFYIREKNVYELKKLIPKSGLQRGRRSLVLPHP
jgi:hypothetical protein